MMPALWGGDDGGDLTRALLDLGFPSAMLMLSGAILCPACMHMPLYCCAALRWFPRHQRPPTRPACPCWILDQHRPQTPHPNCLLPIPALAPCGWHLPASWRPAAARPTPHPPPNPRPPPAYSNPVGTVRHAAQRGYIVTDFIAVPLPFGTYSSQPQVCGGAALAGHHDRERPAMLHGSHPARACSCGLQPSWPLPP